jgi:hypothetical protein
VESFAVKADYKSPAMVGYINIFVQQIFQLCVQTP